MSNLEFNNNGKGFMEKFAIIGLLIVALVTGRVTYVVVNSRNAPELEETARAIANVGEIALADLSEDDLSYDPDKELPFVPAITCGETGTSLGISIDNKAPLKIACHDGVALIPLSILRKVKDSVSFQLFGKSPITNVEKPIGRLKEFVIDRGAQKIIEKAKPSLIKNLKKIFSKDNNKIFLGFSVIEKKKSKKKKVVKKTASSDPIKSLIPPNTVVLADPEDDKYPDENVKPDTNKISDFPVLAEDLTKKDTGEIKDNTPEEEEPEEEDDDDDPPPEPNPEPPDSDECVEGDTRPECNVDNPTPSPSPSPSPTPTPGVTGDTVTVYATPAGSYGGYFQTNPLVITLIASTTYDITSTPPIYYCLSENTSCDPTSSGSQFITSITIGPPDGNFYLAYYAIDEMGNLSSVMEEVYILDTTNTPNIRMANTKLLASPPPFFHLQTNEVHEYALLSSHFGDANYNFWQMLVPADSFNKTCAVLNTDYPVGDLGTNGYPYIVKSTALRGTVSVAAGSDVLNGTNTKFLDEISVGDYLDIAGEVIAVKSITTDILLELERVHVAIAGPVTAYPVDVTREQLTGTVVATDNDLAGTSSVFTTDPGTDVGDYMEIGGKHYMVTSVTDDANLVMTPKDIDSATGTAYMVDLYPQAMTGTVTIGIGTTAVAGTATTFTTEFVVGDWILIGSEIGVVASITDNFNLDLKDNRLIDQPGLVVINKYDTESVSLTGTVTTDGTTNVVTGVGTDFETELKVGAQIKIDTVYFLVTAINSATELEINSIPAVLGAAPTTNQFFATKKYTTVTSVHSDMTQLTGAVTVAAAAAAVTGVGTVFNDELAVGKSIIIAGEEFTVNAVNSDTSVTLSANHVAGARGIASYTGGVYDGTAVTNLINTTVAADDAIFVRLGLSVGLAYGNNYMVSMIDGPAGLSCPKSTIVVKDFAIQEINAGGGSTTPVIGVMGAFRGYGFFRSAGESITTVRTGKGTNQQQENILESGFYNIIN